MRDNQNRTGRLMSAVAMMTIATSTGCIGGRFNTVPTPAPLDPPSQTVIDRVTADRAARNFPAATQVAELRPPAVRGATAVARGDQSLKTAAHETAQRAVTEMGRHIWTFATECTDLQRFRPPPLVLEQKALLLGAAAIPAPGGRTIVMLVVADPGTSSLRADQMGGGTGGTNPSMEAYVHPSVATSACGETWPAAQRTPL
jgi:hypothetical protein